MHFFDTYTAELSAALDGVSRDAFDALVEAIKQLQANDGFVYTCGNGGSAATASHMVNDLVKAPADATGCRPIRAVGLTDCVPLMTALANDIDYEHAFSHQLKAYGRKGDLLIAFSGSGNSPNVLEAARTARDRGMTVAAMTGYDGGALGPLADIHLHVASNSMAQVEDAHLVLEHALVEVLKEELKGA